MIKSASIALIAQFLFIQSVAAADIMEVTTYHNDECKAQSGQMWLALFSTKNGQYELKNTRVKLTMVNDAINDEAPNLKTGKQITIPEKQEPLALLRGISGLTERKVVTCSTNKKEHMDINQKITLKLAKQQATLSTTGGFSKEEKECRTNYKIILESGGIKQTLVHHNQISSDTAPSLLWAGDLDGDGKIDLIMDTTDHYNVRDLTLFLSGKAKPGALVEKVAHHISTGC
ncbi:MAG: hypothetical protein IT343_20765 [Candidatus Melainabacteria bacterium]|jgi:hypothetical protein|nr:hypothetical protein [Candidatus Melainabacteria bacterium]